jgi:hypothetical protein
MRYIKARLARIEARAAERDSKSFIVAGSEDEAATIRAAGLAEGVTIIITGVPRKNQQIPS